MSKKNLEYCFNCKHFVRYYMKAEKRIIPADEGLCLKAQIQKNKTDPCPYWQTDKRPAVLHADYNTIQKTIDRVRIQLDEILLQLSVCVVDTDEK